MSILDLIVFFAFVAAVVSIGLYKSRGEDLKGEHAASDYFLAGRGLKWWLIGFSLIAANISTEQFVGMSGNAASHIGIAIASYEWMAAITLVVVAFAFLPYFLKAGIYTMPEFLEYRYNSGARIIMAAGTVFIYLLLLGAVTYSGALTIRTIAAERGVDISLQLGALVIGLIAMIYVIAGGLKACAWADLIQGSALIIGGGIIMYFSFGMLGSAESLAGIADVKTGEVVIRTFSPETGAFARFMELNSTRLNMFLPATDSTLPWTALLLGLWIPNFYYWGLNQYITQRTLGSASLAEGQKGIVFSAFMKLLIPFVIVVPGIMAFNLFAGNMHIAAGKDNGPVLAKYLAANPASAVVSVEMAPSVEQLASIPDSRYVLAVYPDLDSVNSAKMLNGHVFPLSQDQFNAAQASVSAAVVFESDDYAFASANPALAAELAVYNETVRASNASVSTEKLLGYKYDTALGQLLSNVLPQGTGLLGFVLAALLGAVVSSLAAMLNAASTIFSMDIFKQHINKNASQRTIVVLGRSSVAVFAVIAVVLAPMLGNPKISNSIFTVIQEGQGLISPGILAVFAFGLLFHRGPRICGVVGLLTNIIAYPALKFAAPDINFLNRMAICFFLCILVMGIITLIKPLDKPIDFKANNAVALEASKGARIAGIGVVILTLMLYVVFSPIGIAG
ncbi:sodium/solute symporter [Puniceicoccales bacterium CK1056]|uniref:Sodium/solute symporter n=1 Tax=Oceanipulchritudo coccoides TaxID=2706888 RepID=A0A6B2M115_9BACT|nr:sodium/solute symporter [Oceanipulchritudo coccoides]NDV61475.1 sodium/solute symporter [Oceanipulchritudo coccoides]